MLNTNNTTDWWKANLFSLMNYKVFTFVHNLNIMNYNKWPKTKNNLNYTSSIFKAKSITSNNIIYISNRYFWMVKLYKNNVFRLIISK